MPRPRVQLLIHFGYDGSRFHGLQPQKDVPTAGGALRARLEDAADGVWAKALTYAARTDAGVHCLANLATCYFPVDIDVDTLRKKLEADRPDGLFNLTAEVVPYTVHARGAGRGKRYRYILDDGCPQGSLDDDKPRTGALFERGIAWPITPRLDGDRMRKAAPHLVGTHDYSSFRARKCEIKSPIKTIVRVGVGGPFPLADGRRRFVVDIVGTAFIRRQIRYMVGCLAEVGAGLREPHDVGRLLAAKDRKQQGVCAPARGLTLMRVGCAYPADGSARLPELSHLEDGVSDEERLESGLGSVDGSSNKDASS